MLVSLHPRCPVIVGLTFSWKKKTVIIFQNNRFYEDVSFVKVLARLEYKNILLLFNTPQIFTVQRCRMVQIINIIQNCSDNKISNGQQMISPTMIANSLPDKSIKIIQHWLINMASKEKFFWTYQNFYVSSVNLLLKVPTLLRLEKPRQILNGNFHTMSPFWGIRFTRSTHVTGKKSTTATK